MSKWWEGGKGGMRFVNSLSISSKWWEGGREEGRKGGMKGEGELRVIGWRKGGREGGRKGGRKSEDYLPSGPGSRDRLRP